MIQRLFFVLCVCIGLFLLGQTAAWADHAVRIGVLAYEGNPQTRARWQPTVDYLNRLIPGHRFSMDLLSHDEIDQLLFKNQLDFVLTNPGHYVRLEDSYGISRLVTFKSQFQRQTLNQFGAVILTRPDRGITQLADLKGKKLAAVSAQAFGGYQMALRELMLEEDQVLDDLEWVWLGFPQEDIVSAVVNGLVDAGTVRTGVVEKMMAEGRLDPAAIRILAPKTHPGFPLKISTALYPEWPFARAPETDRAISEQVALALLNMPADGDPARASRGAGWTIPSIYTTVHDLYRHLQLPPYAPQPLSQESVWQEYKTWIVLSVVLFAAILVMLFFLLRANCELRGSRLRLVQQQGSLQEAVRDRTHDLQRLEQQLEQEHLIISNSETEHRQICETLRAMTRTSIRKDLSHQQRLQSIVDIGGQHMQAQKAVLSRIQGGGLKVCAVSPIEEQPENNAPIDVAQLLQAVERSNAIQRGRHASGLEYLICPVTAGDKLVCVLEMLLESSVGQDVLAEPDDLRQQALQLILHWAADELIRMQVDEEETERTANDRNRFNDLTRRELQVLELMSAGLSNKEMARKLGISIKTVELHRSNLLRKTGMQSSLEMVKTATQVGIVA
jgi:ABC-type phosphate/phosphonate transport system substrate-binding protein/DNA-binding CsgD family transcriptional regulator